jgi:hypothetical protein
MEVDSNIPEFKDPKEEKLYMYRFELRNRYEDVPDFEKLAKV